MALGSYISKSKGSILYVLHILQNRTDPDHPLKQGEIQKILADDPYNMDMNRETVEATLLELQQFFDDSIVCSSSEKNDGSEYKTGWYFRQPASDARIEELIAYLNLSDLPAEAVEENIGLLKSFRSKNYLDINIDSDSTLYSKQHSLSRIGADNYLKINEIINDNRRDPDEEILLDFEECYNEIENGKVVLKRKPASYINILPLTIVEWDYKRVLICCNEINMYHVRLDMIRKLEKKKVKKTRNKLIRSFIAQVSTKEKINAYINSHALNDATDNIFIANDKTVYRVELRLNRKDVWREGINGFLDEFPDGFKILANDENYHYVQVKTTLLKLLDVLIAHHNQIDVVSPDGIREAMELELKIYGNAILNNDFTVTRINIVRDKNYKTDIDYDIDNFSLAEICCTIEQISIKEEWTYREYSGIYNIIFDDGSDFDDVFVQYLQEQGFRRITISKDNDGFYSEGYRNKEDIDRLLKGFYRDPVTDYNQSPCFMPFYLSDRTYETLLGGKRINYDQRYGITSRSDNDMMNGVPQILDPYQTSERLFNPDIDRFEIDDQRLRIIPTTFVSEISICTREQLQKKLAEGLIDNTAIVSILKDDEKPLNIAEKYPHLNTRIGDDDLYIKEITDFIREVYGQGMDIICQDKDGRLGAALAAAIKEYYEGDGKLILKESRYKADTPFYEKVLAQLKR